MEKEDLFKIAKPILFNTKMVQAILDNKKTVTRRIIKISSGYELEGTAEELSENIKIFGSEELFYGGEVTKEEIKPPYCIGDILYIRETWQQIDKSYFYRADGAQEDWGIAWKPSIHMPKEAARIFLKVTDVRIEKLQDITLTDIESEGYGEIEDWNIPGATAGIAFEWWEKTWNSTVKKEDLYKYGMDADPWVWVIEFEKVYIISNYLNKTFKGMADTKAIKEYHEYGVEIRNDKNEIKSFTEIFRDLDCQFNK